MAYVTPEPTGLLEQDWMDLYWYVAKKDQEIADILYDLDRAGRDVQTVSMDYNRPVEEIEEIREQYIDGRLATLKRKVQ